MLNKNESSSWGTDEAVDYDDIPFVLAVPVPAAEETGNPQNGNDADIPVISLPPSSVYSNNSDEIVNKETKYQEEEDAKPFDGYTTNEESPLPQDWRELKRQAKTEWKNWKRCVKHEAKVHKQLLKEEQRALKQEWKCQKHALKQASRSCGQTFNDQARLWRDVAREESRAMKCSFRHLKEEKMAAVEETKREMLELSRSLRDIWKF
jgi:hypothetical protein